MTKTLLRMFSLGLALCVVVGCGGGNKKAAPVKVTGMVKQANGTGLPGGTINFQPSGEGTSGSGSIKSDGTYEIDVPPGDYKVGIDNSSLKSLETVKGGEKVAMPGMADTSANKYVPINVKYTKPDTSGFTAKVEATGGKFDFELK